MNKGLKYTLIGIMCLSIITNLWLIMSIGYVALEYEDEMYYNSLEWCEFSNDQTDLINDLIEHLQYYNETYNELEFFEEVDCWGE